MSDYVHQYPCWSLLNNTWVSFHVVRYYPAIIVRYRCLPWVTTNDLLLISYNSRKDLFMVIWGTSCQTHNHTEAKKGKWLDAHQRRKNEKNTKRNKRGTQKTAFARNSVFQMRRT